MKVLSAESRQRIRCQRCGGNAYLETIDERELRCLQCSRLIARLTPVAALPVRELAQAA